MAKRFSRRRSVRGRPNYCWISTAGIGLLDGTNNLTIHDNILIPSDWQSSNIVENETTLCHIVYTHAAYGVAATAVTPFCSLYAICKTNDQPPASSPPNLGMLASFPTFFTEYDECLHWGQYTTMPNSQAVEFGTGVWPAGGSLAAMPENMVNLNVRRKMKGDEAIKVIWGTPEYPIGDWYVRWFARSLVRLGLK